jgi:hypothetical protein
MANYIPASVSSLKNYGNFQDFYSDQNLSKHPGATCHNRKGINFSAKPGYRNRKELWLTAEY